MMKSIFILFSLFFLLFSNNLFADKIDSLIRSKYKIQNSYNLLVFDTRWPITTLGPMLTREYKILKERNNPSEIIFLLSKSEIIRQNQIQQFFLEAFNIDASKHLVIQDDSLYNSLMERYNLPRVFVIQNRKLTYKSDFKWSSTKDNKLERKIRYSVSFEDSIALQNPNYVFNSNAKILSYDSSSFLVFTDIKDQIIRYNLNGKIESQISSYDFSAVDLFCQYFAIDSAQCVFAKQNEAMLKFRNRQCFNFSKAFVKNDTIYIIAAVEAMVLFDRDLKYTNDLGNTNITPKGTADLASFTCLVTLNKNLELITIRKIEFPDDQKEFFRRIENYILPDVGFYMIDKNQFIVGHEYFPSLRKRKPFISRFTYNDSLNTYSVDSYYKFNISSKLFKRYQKSMEFKFTHFNNDYLVANTYYNDVWSLSTGKKVIQFGKQFSNTLEKENFPRFLEDGVFYTNFQINNFQTLNSEYLAIQYDFGKQFSNYLDLYNSKLEYVQTIDLDLFGLNSKQLFLLGNKLSYLKHGEENTFLHFLNLDYIK